MRRARGEGKRPPLARQGAAPYITAMNYILALLLPPLSVLLAGRPIVAVISFLIWVPAIVISGGLGHPAFIVLAWIIIFERNRDRAA